MFLGVDFASESGNLVIIEITYFCRSMVISVIVVDWRTRLYNKIMVESVARDIVICG